MVNNPINGALSYNKVFFPNSRLRIIYLLLAAFFVVGGVTEAVKCTLVKDEFDSSEDSDWKICVVNHLAQEGRVIEVESDFKVKRLNISHNKDVKFIPENMDQVFPDLWQVDILNCSIEVINSRHFRNLHKLGSLDLRYNKIESISSDSFNDLVGMEVLLLDHNKIQSLSSNVFDPMKNLEILTLSENRLFTLSERIFNKLKNLKIIELSSNGLAEIPDGLFTENSALESISLDFNQIRAINTRVFDNLNLLTAVHLKGNVCVNKAYKEDDLPDKLKQDVDRNCRQAASSRGGEKVEP